jgi:hypothetical protein
MIQPYNISVGLIENIGYGTRKKEAEIRLSVRDGNDTRIFYLDLDTAAKVARRIQAYAKAGRTI